jgi:hypothetical protein
VQSRDENGNYQFSRPKKIVDNTACITISDIKNNQILEIATCTGYFTSDNENGGIQNTTHNKFPKLT